MKNQYKYVYTSDILKNTYNEKDFVLLPLFIDFDFYDIKSGLIPLSLLLDPFLELYEKNKNELNDICYHIFKKNLIINNQIFCLSSEENKAIPLKGIEKLVIFAYYKIKNGSKKITIPFCSAYKNINNPFYLINFIESLNINDLFINFISDDKVWLSLYNQDIKTDDIYWVEGDFDKFTYSFFMPQHTYEIAGNWLNIIKILEKNNNCHYGIIDKDGFSYESRNQFTFYRKIFLSRYSECENIWMRKDILNIFEQKVKGFSSIDFQKEVIQNAQNDKDNTIHRFNNRQIKLKELYYPYHKNSEKIVDKYELALQKADYDSILSFYDNKALFNLLLKRISCKNIKAFYELVKKLKKQIRRLEINPII